MSPREEAVTGAEPSQSNENKLTETKEARNYGHGMSITRHEFGREMTYCAGDRG